MTITPGSGLVINVTYDSSVGGAPSGFKTAVAAAVLELESIFTNPITVTYVVGFGSVFGNPVPAGNHGIGLSSFMTAGYSLLQNALTQDALPVTDPTNGARFDVTTSEARAPAFRSFIRRTMMAPSRCRAHFYSPTTPATAPSPAWSMLLARWKMSSPR